MVALQSSMRHRIARVSVIALCSAGATLAWVAPGCRDSKPLPLPDALRTSGVVLSATPGSLVIRPSSSGRLRFGVVDSTGLALADYPIAFSIVDDNGEPGATLSSDRCATDDDGNASLEIIVGALPVGNQPTAFSVRATSPGAEDVLADVLVTTNAYSVEILPVPADDLLGSTQIANTRLYFYDDLGCANVDIYRISATSAWARTPHVVALNSPYVFSGVAASGSHAVVGLGLDASNQVQIGGCLDIPGSALLDSETIRATLYMDHLFPNAAGTYAAASDFNLSPAPSALAAIQSAWQQWTRCPYDPARLWIDCTIDALVTDDQTDPNDCVPVTGSEGTLGALLLARRGTAVGALSGTLAGSYDTQCRGATDSSGNSSLEYLVDGLFSVNRATLTSAKLGTLPTEASALLSTLHVDSVLTLTATNNANQYDIDHDLVDVTFPNGVSSVSLKIANLALPVTSVTNLVGAVKAGALSIPSHAITLRLGTTARYAYEKASLAPRSAENSAALARAITGLAQMTDQHNRQLTGCDALDALLCDQAKQPRGCLSAACQSGLSALASRLEGAFARLDGSGLDFQLAGSAPVVDLDGNGQAEALGMAGSTGTATAAPGLWSATFQTQSTSYATYGSWTASLKTSTP